MQLLPCILTSAASFLGEPYHRFPCLSWKTSHEVLTETSLQHSFRRRERRGGDWVSHVFAPQWCLFILFMGYRKEWPQLPTTVACVSSLARNKGPIPIVVCKARKNFVGIKLVKPSPILEHGKGMLFRGHQVDLLWQNPHSGYRKFLFPNQMMSS